MSVLRGQVYFPSQLLPPTQATKHRVVIVSNNNATSALGAEFVVVAIIRSAKRQDGTPVRPVPLHSVALPASKYNWLQHDSYAETHQLFSLPLKSLSKEKILGTVSQPELDRILMGAAILCGPVGLTSGINKTGP